MELIEVSGKIAPNQLKRNFISLKPNQKWLTDITEFKVNDGKKCYLSPILDTFNNEIIACQLSRSPNWALVQKMLIDASPICHSDQGWHYQMAAYQRILRENGIRQSM